MVYMGVYSVKKHFKMLKDVGIVVPKLIVQRQRTWGGGGRGLESPKI